MKRTIIAVSVCLSLVPSGASALDWSLNSTLSETVELNDNPFLRALAAGTFSSYSTIVANATARTPISKFMFDGSVSYQKYWGPGVDGAPSENLSGGANFHYETYGKNNSDRQYLDAGWHRSTTAFALLGQLAIITPTRGFLDTTSAGGGIDRSITARDSVSLSAHSTYTSYDPGTGGTPFIDTLASGTWRHRFNSIATVSDSSDAEFLHFDNVLNTDITILREKAGIDAALSALLSFSGTAGVAYVQTERGSPAFSLVPARAKCIQLGGSCRLDRQHGADLQDVSGHDAIHDRREKYFAECGGLADQIDLDRRWTDTKRQLQTNFVI